jgi:hypothetical protein
MVSCGMLRRVALVITNVSEERITSIIRVTRIGEPGILLAVLATEARCEEILHSISSHFAYSCFSDDRGDIVLRNVCPFKSHTT